MIQESMPTSEGADNLDFTKMTPEGRDYGSPLEAISTDEAIKWFENNEEESDIERKVNEMISGLGSEISTAKIGAALVLQRSVREHLMALERSSTTELPGGLILKARKLSERLSEALRPHIQ